MQPLKRQPSDSWGKVITVYIPATNEKEADGAVSPAVNPFHEKIIIAAKQSLMMIQLINSNHHTGCLDDCVYFFSFFQTESIG